MGGFQAWEEDRDTDSDFGDLKLVGLLAASGKTSCGCDPRADNVLFAPVLYDVLLWLES